MTEQTSTVDKVVDKLPSGDKLMDTLTNVVNDITHKVVEVAPKAWEVLLKIKQVESIGSIGVALLSSIVAVFIISIYFKNLIAWVNLSEKCNAEGGVACCKVAIGGIMSFFSAIILFRMVIFYLLDIWLWVGVFHPDLAIAHDVYVKATEVVSK